MKKYYQRFRSYSINELGLKPQLIIWSGVIGLGVLISIPKVNQINYTREMRVREIKALNLKQEELERELRFEQQQEMIANKRYKSCLPVVGQEFKNGTHYFTGISEGQEITDRITDKPLPQGVVVCDIHGVTGVLDSEGKVKNIAYTGDRKVIQTRLKRFRGSQYSQPIVKVEE